MESGWYLWLGPRHSNREILFRPGTENAGGLSHAFNGRLLHGDEQLGTPICDRVWEILDFIVAKLSSLRAIRRHQHSKRRAAAVHTWDLRNAWTSWYLWGALEGIWRVFGNDTEGDPERANLVYSIESKKGGGIGGLGRLSMWGRSRLLRIYQRRWRESGRVEEVSHGKQSRQRGAAYGEGYSMAYFSPPRHRRRRRANEH